MTEMISNIWNINALLGGIIVFILLLIAGMLSLTGLLMVFLAPFRRNHINYEDE